MHTFKGYLTEATKQKLWSDAIGAKPEKYGAGFVELVKSDHTFDLLDGSDAVVLDKSNTKLLDVFSGALSKETLINDILAADPDQKIIKWNKTKSGKYQSPKWKVIASNNNIDYIPINHLGKDEVKPSSNPSGGEWESMISIGYNMQRLKQTVGPTETSAKAEEYGISFKEYESMKKDFWGKWGAPAIEVGKAFYAQKDFGGAKMTQYGKGSGTLTGAWKTWHTGGKKNTTPKTDMYVGAGGKGQRISLKKVGGGQVMSGAAGESIATFNAALAWMGEENNKEVSKMIDDMKSGFKKVALDGSITDLKAKKGFAATLDDKKRDALMGQLATQDLVHEQLSEDMNTLFNNHPQLKYWFIYEAATGGKKFGPDDTATADFVIEFDPSKTGSSAIKKFKNMGNPSEVNKLANETQFYCSFKTGKKDPYTAMRTKHVAVDKNTNSEEYIPTLRHLIIDHIESNESTRRFLPENYEQLDEFALLNRAIQGIKKGASRLKTGVKDMWMNLTDRVKIFLEGLFKKVSAALDKIKRLAGKALNALLEFFGFEVDKVDSSGPAIIFHKMV